MKVLKQISALISSKYFIAGLSFIIWMIFFDSNDIPLQEKRVRDLRQLQQSEKNLNAQIEGAKKELSLLKTNPSTLEKYAREKYMMKRDNEDLYIIIKPPKNP